MVLKENQKKMLSIFKCRGINFDVVEVHAHIAARANRECSTVKKRVKTLLSERSLFIYGYLIQSRTSTVHSDEMN